MAKCKLCKKEISDGAEYCAECADKKNVVSNESYLDELLNSVQNRTTTASDIYKKKKKDQGMDSSDFIVPQKSEEPSFIDQDDLVDFEKYDIMKEFDNPGVPEDEDTDDKISQSDANDDNELHKMIESDDEDSVDDIEPVLDDLLKHLNMDEDNDESEIYNSNDMDTSSVSHDMADSDDAVNMDTSTDSHDKEDNDEAVDQDAFNDIDDIADINSLIGNDSNDKEISAENELLELLNQLTPDNHEEDDIKAITDLLGEIDINNQKAKDYPEDIGEVFSKTLEAVSDLSDSDQGIQYITPDSDGKDKKKVKEKKKDKGDKKQGWFAKLFSDLDEDADQEEKKEQDAKAAREDKKNKKKKGKKAQVATNADEIEAPAKDKKEAESSEEKKKVKKAKKEKKPKIEILDDEVDEGRINKTGASVVFLFFGVLVMMLLISTNIFSYSLSIKNATDYFGRQKYTKAYNEVYGIELKDEDIELYDKIMTVMFVNKQLSSYNNYYHMRKFPEALDSLLKGLQRYDKYVELATMLGIKTDLDYVRDQIVAELYNVFSLTEEEALKIINSESQAQYSIAVYDVILENISYYN